MYESIKEVGRTETQAYGVKFVVCINDEVISESLDWGEDLTGNGWSDEAREAHGNAARVLYDAGFDYESEGRFAKYNGGPYSDLVTPLYYTAELLEDDERDEWCSVWLTGPGKTETPAEIMAKVEAVAEQAMAAMEEVSV